MTACVTKDQIRETMHYATMAEAASALKMTVSELSRAHRRLFHCQWNSSVPSILAVCCKLWEVSQLDCLGDKDRAALDVLGPYFQDHLHKIVADPAYVAYSETEHTRSLDRAHRLYSHHYLNLMDANVRMTWETMPADRDFGFPPLTDDESESDVPCDLSQVEAACDTVEDVSQLAFRAPRANTVSRSTRSDKQAIFAADQRPRLGLAHRFVLWDEDAIELDSDTEIDPPLSPSKAARRLPRVINLDSDSEDTHMEIC